MGRERQARRRPRTSIQSQYRRHPFCSCSGSRQASARKGFRVLLLRPRVVFESRLFLRFCGGGSLDPFFSVVVRAWRSPRLLSGRRAASPSFSESLSPSLSFLAEYLLKISQRQPQPF